MIVARPDFDPHADAKPASRASPHPISCAIRARIAVDSTGRPVLPLQGRSSAGLRTTTCSATDACAPPRRRTARVGQSQPHPSRVDLTAAHSRTPRSRTPPPGRCSCTRPGSRSPCRPIPCAFSLGRGESAISPQHADRSEALDCRLAQARRHQGRSQRGEDLTVDGKVDGTIELPQHVSDGPRGQPWSPAGRVVVCPSVSRARDSSSEDTSRERAFMRYLPYAAVSSEPNVIVDDMANDRTLITPSTGVGAAPLPT